MGKNKKGKKGDVEKKVALAARKEAKAEKAAQKRQNKETRKSGEDVVESDNDDNDDNNYNNNDDDMDQLISLYKQMDVDMKGPCKVVGIDGFPLARSNATLTITTDTKKKEVYLFGGEYYNGINTIVSNQLYKYDLNTNKWKQLVFTHGPQPRCAHSTIYYNKCLYVFGGECNDIDNDTYIHYKDLWKFDTIKLQWNEIKPYGNGTVPTPRSGHVVTVWKQYMILFGGFYEGPKDQPPRWYNDLYVFHLQQEQWIHIPHSKLTLRPEPRSACNTALLINDGQWLIQGGFTKLLKQRQQQTTTIGTGEDSPILSETKVHTDSWILHLNPLLSNQQPTWERWTSSIISIEQQFHTSKMTACGRSGVGSTSYNNNMLCFGGVFDQEFFNHKLNSIFYNDLSIFHIEKRKFIPFHINSNNTKDNDDKVIGRQDNEDNDNDNNNDYDDENNNNSNIIEGLPPNGWDLDRLRNTLFSFTDNDGNTVYEKLILDGKKTNDNTDINEISSTTKDNNMIIHKVIEPLPRIKPCMFMNGTILYIYGGILEVDDREITMDDMWMIDIRKKKYWECIYPGTMNKQIWKGSIDDDDNESYYSNATSDKNTNNAEESDDDEDEEEEEKDEEEKDEEKIKEEKEISSKSIKKKITKLVEKYDLENDNITQQPDESFNDFYKRTCEYWKKNEYNENEDTALQMAQQRYDNIKPILEQIINLMIQRQEMKDKEGKKLLEKKKEKKKSNKK